MWSQGHLADDGIFAALLYILTQQAGCSTPLQPGAIMLPSPENAALCISFLSLRTYVRAFPLIPSSSPSRPF